MIVNASFDYSVVGREATRASDGSMHCGFDPALLRLVDSKRSPEFKAFADRIEGVPTATQLSGMRGYYDSDYVRAPPLFFSNVLDLVQVLTVLPYRGLGHASSKDVCSVGARVLCTHHQCKVCQ